MLFIASNTNKSQADVSTRIDDFACVFLSISLSFSYTWSVAARRKATPCKEISKSKAQAATIIAKPQPFKSRGLISIRSVSPSTPLFESISLIEKSPLPQRAKTSATANSLSARSPEIVLSCFGQIS